MLCFVSINLLSFLKGKESYSKQHIHVYSAMKGSKLHHHVKHFIYVSEIEAVWSFNAVFTVGMNYFHFCRS